METNHHQGEKTQQIERLRAQKNEFHDKCFGPNRIADDEQREELKAKWRALIAEIDTLERSFVLYLGREIDATRVNYLIGTIPTSTVDHHGDEMLYRDEEGRYYLWRKLDTLDVDGKNRQASGRTLIHRITIKAAILWALTRLNTESMDLRHDVATLLMEGRGFVDPDPTHPHTSERTVVNLLHADGSLYARVPLEPDLEAKLEEMAREEGTDIGTVLVNCLRRFQAEQQATLDGTTEPATVTVPLTLPIHQARSQPLRCPGIRAGKDRRNRPRRRRRG